MDVVVAFVLSLLLIILACSVIVPLSIILYVIILPFLERFGIIERVTEGQVKTKEEDNGCA